MFRKISRLLCGGWPTGDSRAQGSDGAGDGEGEDDWEMLGRPAVCGAGKLCRKGGILPMRDSPEDENVGDRTWSSWERLRPVWDLGV